MDQVVDAARTFFEHLASVGWTALGIALGFHVARLAARSLAWRNIIAAAYPGVRVPRLGVFGAYVAGVGLNSVVPARAGDALKLVLVKRQVEGSTYTTLTPTLFVETLFDLVVAAVIIGWALTQDLLPALDVLPDLPSIDWYWPLHHPRPAIAIAIVWITVIALLVAVWARRVRDFKERVRQGVAILRTPRRYLTLVVSWQALSWVLRGATIYACLQAFHVHASVRNTLLILAVQSISTLLPFTPGGIGTQQGLIVYAFRNETVSKSVLISFSVGMQIATTACNVLLGLIAMLVMARTVRWKRLLAPEREEVEQAQS
jgi:glycosyltransferase 2 family protein